MAHRITTAHGKTVYVAFGLIGVTLVSVTGAVLGGATAGAVVSTGAFWAWIVIGARMFRGSGEPVERPRDWWRFTAAPTAGFVLAAVLGLQAAGTAIGVWFTAMNGGDSGTTGIAAVGSAGAALAYLNSSLRLRALDRPPQQL